MSIFHDNIGTGVSNVTITLNGLGSSLTAGRQSDVVTVVDGSNRVPDAIDFEVSLTLAAGTPANDKAAYVFIARSVDGSDHEVGPPAVGASDAAFTFSSSPVGSSALPTDLHLLGVVPFNLTGEVRRRAFRLFAPPAKFAIVVLNYSGVALAGSGNSIQYRARNAESV
jgi:hypothetical protein